MGYSTSLKFIIFPKTEHAEVFYSSTTTIFRCLHLFFISEKQIAQSLYFIVVEHQRDKLVPVIPKIITAINSCCLSLSPSVRG